MGRITGLAVSLIVVLVAGAAALVAWPALARPLGAAPATGALLSGNMASSAPAGTRPPGPGPRLSQSASGTGVTLQVAAPNVVLYDQYDNATNGATNSQQYERFDKA